MQQDGHEALQGRTLLLVLSGSSGRRRILRRLVQAGVTLVCYSAQRTWAAEHVAEHNWVLGPVDDPPEALRRVQAWQARAAGPDAPGSAAAAAAGQQLDGVLCIDEYGLVLAAALAEGLGLPFTRRDAMDELRNKWRFRAACVRGGVRSPRFVPLHGPLTAQDVQRIQELGMRCARPLPGSQPPAATGVKGVRAPPSPLTTRPGSRWWSSRPPAPARSPSRAWTRGRSWPTPRAPFSPRCRGTWRRWAWRRTRRAARPGGAWCSRSSSPDTR